jgi:membrane protein implicated in regulation of membrane protease activity
MIGFHPPALIAALCLAFLAFGVVAVAESWSLVFLYVATAGCSLAAIIGYDRWYERNRR